METTFIFKSKPRHVTLQIVHFRKSSPVLMFSTHIYGVSKKDRWENIHIYSKPRHVTTSI